jgi:hypothetical protein
LRLAVCEPLGDTEYVAGAARETVSLTWPIGGGIFEFSAGK